MLLIIKKRRRRIGVFSKKMNLNAQQYVSKKISHNEMLYSHLNVGYESIKDENNILKKVRIVECSFN